MSSNGRVPPVSLTKSYAKREQCSRRTTLPGEKMVLHLEQIFRTTIHKELRGISLIHFSFLIRLRKSYWNITRPKGGPLVFVAHNYSLTANPRQKARYITGSSLSA